mgnify:CR=1 FL=1
MKKNPYSEKLSEKNWVDRKVPNFFEIPKFEFFSFFPIVVISSAGKAGVVVKTEQIKFVYYSVILFTGSCCSSWMVWVKTQAWL